jgi:hypothetical protein
LRHTVRMLHLRISVPAELTDDVLSVLADDPAVSSLANLRGASLRPVGDVITADIAREAANLLNLSGMALAGWATLAFQAAVCPGSRHTARGWRSGSAATETMAPRRSWAVAQHLACPHGVGVRTGQ